MPTPHNASQRILSFFTGRHSPSDLCKTNDLHMHNTSNCVWVQILFMFCCIRAPLWKTANRFRKQSEKYNRGKTPSSIICFTIIFPSGALRTIIKKIFQHRTELKDSWTWARQGQHIRISPRKKIREKPILKVSEIFSECENKCEFLAQVFRHFQSKI